MFLAMWFGSSAVAYRLGAPILFPAVFWMIGGLVLVFWIDLTLADTTIAFTHDHVRIVKSVFGLTRNREVPRSSIASVAVKVGMSQHGNGVQASRAYYDIALLQPDHRRKVISCNLRDRREAQWLAEEIANRLGIDAEVEMRVAPPALAPTFREVDREKDW